MKIQNNFRIREVETAVNEIGYFVEKMNKAASYDEETVKNLVDSLLKIECFQNDQDDYKESSLTEEEKESRKKFVYEELMTNLNNIPGELEFVCTVSDRDFRVNDEFIGDGVIELVKGNTPILGLYKSAYDPVSKEYENDLRASLVPRKNHYAIKSIRLLVSNQGFYGKNGFYHLLENSDNHVYHPFVTEKENYQVLVNYNNMRKMVKYVDEEGNKVKEIYTFSYPTEKDFQENPKADDMTNEEWLEKLFHLNCIDRIVKPKKIEEPKVDETEVTDTNKKKVIFNLKVGKLKDKAYSLVKKVRNYCDLNIDYDEVIEKIKRK